MKKSEFKFDFATLNGGGEEARRMPLFKGTVLHFTLSDGLFKKREETLGGAVRKWDDVVSDEGIGISTKQVSRIGNGLPLEGSTLGERMESWKNLFSDEGTITMTVTNVFTRPRVDTDGSFTSQNYYTFEIS